LRTGPPVALAYRSSGSYVPVAGGGVASCCANAGPTWTIPMAAMSRTDIHFLGIVPSPCW